MKKNTSIKTHRQVFYLWVFLFTTSLQINSSAQVIVFDDFNYYDANDLALGTFNKWQIVNNTDGPIYPAKYSGENIHFIKDSTNAKNKIMTLTATCTNKKEELVNARIQAKGYDYINGTYAARVYFDNTPSLSKDGTVQTFYAIVDYRLGPDSLKYSEVDFEYLPYDVWGNTENKTMYMCAYNSYTDTSMSKSCEGSSINYSGWHDLVFSFTDGKNVKYWIDGKFMRQASVTSDGTGRPVYPRSPMQVAFANWLWHDEQKPLGASKETRAHTMKVDWFLYVEGQEKSTEDMIKIVSDFRSKKIKRQNRLGETY